MRSMAGSRSQLKAMSVALDDHGEWCRRAGDQEQFAGVGAGRLLFQQFGQFARSSVHSGRALRHDIRQKSAATDSMSGKRRRDQAGLQALQTEGGKGGVAPEAKNIGHGTVVSG